MLILLESDRTGTSSIGAYNLLTYPSMVRVSEEYADIIMGRYGVERISITD